MVLAIIIASLRDWGKMIVFFDENHTDFSPKKKIFFDGR
jgi:hypothetical protein